MAKDKSTKEPGRLKQMWQVFQMTRRYDDRAVLYIAFGAALPIVLGVLVAVLLSGGNVFTMVLWILAGVLAGLLLALIILGRRAERAAYSQIEGQPGAVGAVLRSSLKRSWRGSEMPVAVNGKTQDAVYRATGRGGVVLISEGPKTRTQRMIDEERRKVNRILPNVPVTIISVGPDADSVPLHKVPRRLSKIKPTLTKAEVLAISNRLQSIESQMPIPKGIDPMKVRAQRSR
ncbi:MULTISPECIES: DUF4191 domain-containing protein [unclassified Leifsonia]|uniref:DUF4191 domain-containing protein n=1 Tax=unclassified Leifsonia TaxID=2663824 RepID=UPI0008A7684E|nr:MULTISPECIES: DUF4191 domain-containing protein [unclassified Leifsonia]SEH97159.1 protein of unknown function [Leifsonia sp. CL154]SFL63445.1 protein of unknown function [Leifsonia sp. CL147]